MVWDLILLIFSLFLTNNPNCLPIKYYINFLGDIVGNKGFIKWTPSSSILRKLAFLDECVCYSSLCYLIYVCLHREGLTVLVGALSEYLIILNLLYSEKIKMCCFFEKNPTKVKSYQPPKIAFSCVSHLTNFILH